MTGNPHPVSSLDPATRHALEHLPIGTYELRILPNGRPEFTHVSTRWLEMCGLSRAQFMADQGLAIQVIHPDERPGMLEANLQALKHRVPFHWEGRLLVEGEVVWVAITSNPRETEDGELLWEGVMIDVSAYKRLESQLRGHVTQLRRLLEHLPTAVLVASTTPEQQVLLDNAAFERVFGYTLEEVPTVADWARLVYPDPAERAAIWAWWESAVAAAVTGGGRVESRTSRITRKDGGTRDVVISATLVDDVLIAAFEDMTEFKRAEAELFDARQLLDTVLANVDAYIYMKGSDRRYRYINPKVAELYQRPAEEIVGKTDAELFSPETAERFRQLDDQVLLHERRQAAQESIVDATGKTHHFWSVKLPSRCRDDDPGLIGFSTEISELLEVQAAMSRSEARFRALFEATSEAVMLLDTTHFIDCNQATLRLFGMPDRETFRAVHPADLSPSHQPCGTPSLELANRYIQAALREGSRQFEWVHRRFDTGVEIPCEVVLSALDLEGERLLLAAVRDHTERSRAAAELREAKARLEAMLKALPDLMFRIDRSGLIQDFYSSATHLLYLPPEAFLGKRVAEVLPAEAANVLMAAIEEAATQGRHQGGSYSLPTPRGELWYELSIAALGAAELPSTECVVLVRDITRQKRFEQELRLSEQKFRTFVEDANDIIYTLNLAGEFDYLSPNLREILVQDPADFLGRSIATIVHPDDLSRCEAFLQRLLGTREKQSGLEYRVRHQDGDWRWHVTNASPLFDASGALVGMLGIAHDISERKASEARISHLAHYDALTDLPNRALLFDRLQQALRDAERNHHECALMFVDLDRFKPINDTHGHAVGDLVLKSAAQRLLAAVRVSDSIGRIGGDEFLVLLPRLADAESARIVAEKIVRALCEPIAVGELRLQLSCSIGIALYPRDGHDTTTLARHADQAMYRAKRGGRDRIRFAESDLDAED